MSRVFQLNPTAKGMSFARLAMTEAQGDRHDKETYATKRWGADSLAARVAAAGGAEQLAYEKAAVAAGSTASGNWASLLTDAESAASEFFAAVRERSLIGRIAGLRRVPLRIRLITSETGFTAAWVGEGQAKPLSTATYSEGMLDARKVAALTVLTEETLESADPAAEALVRNDLVAAVSAAIDQSFIDPANAGTVGVEPASITNGAPAVASTADGLVDIRALIAAFPGDLERAVLIGSGVSLAALYDPITLPLLGARGGSAIGIPAVASNAAGTTVALIDPDGIAMGEGTADVRTAAHASIEMKDASLTQDATTGAGSTTVSLWQTNAVAVLAEQRVNWEAARPSVAVLTGVGA
ncbi:phage major capsid protein [Parafrankia sp. BMG5.11]|uniref:phage major capsid protein n=1 Tax=Parafrankia sp. BMG5.11 TaxID=222540 RepID=UPI001404B299|nr:phage major capsid protein [Parafrankia sp. BMG5.11]